MHADRQPPHTDSHRYPDRRHHRPALRRRAPPHPRPHRGPNPPGFGTVRHGGPTGHTARRAGAPAAPRPTNQTASTTGRTVIPWPPGPRPRPRPGSAAHRRPGGRPAARGPGGPTRAATRGGRPLPGGSAAGGRWRRTAYTADPTAARRARVGRGRTAETPATNADTSTNGGTWRGNGPDISAEC